VIDGLRRIPNVTVYKRNELPERFHYSKPDHRLGEIFVIPNEGVMFLNVSIGKNNKMSEYFINFFLKFRQRPILPIRRKVIMDGIIHSHQCKLYF
jgi:hypothetical protein